MTQNSTPISAMVCLLVLSAASVVLCAPAHGQQSAESRSAAANTTWLITIKLSANTPTLLRPKLDYDLTCETPPPTPQPVACPVVQTDPSNINVSPGDRVYWTITPATTSTEMWIVHQDAILDNGDSGPATHLHHGKDGDQIGGRTDQYAVECACPHEYYIFVMNGDKAYFADPKYNLGGGGPIETCVQALQRFAKTERAKKEVVKACDQIHKKNEDPK